MHIDTAGTYTLQYTATDSCGNETIEERTVEVISYSTVLFTDGTFIINEKGLDRASNIALHGAVTREYDPMLSDGSNYVFASDSNRPWNAQSGLFKKVEIGSPIAPVSMAFWFMGASTLTDINWDGLSTSAVTDMNSLFFGCNALTTIDLSSFDTSSVTTMEEMFSQCTSLVTLDLSSFNTSNVTRMYRMFYSDRVMQTIYASNQFVANEGISSGYMFGNMRDIIGGAGTRWNEHNANDRTYAHIDGGTADPGYFTARP